MFGRECSRGAISVAAEGFKAGRTPASGRLPARAGRSAARHDHDGPKPAATVITKRSQRGWRNGALYVSRRTILIADVTGFVCCSEKRIRLGNRCSRSSSRSTIGSLIGWRRSRLSIRSESVFTDFPTAARRRCACRQCLTVTRFRFARPTSMSGFGRTSRFESPYSYMFTGRIRDAGVWNLGHTF